jgi:3',5'-cyclic AMP phosphodiesterase CpdA
VPTRLLHVSDLHFGAGDEPQLDGALTRLIERVSPELVIASGDLTDRGRREQHERAAAFLRGLGSPVLAVPGNHDIPYAIPARFTSPWREFERQWETVEPTYASEDVHVVGLNSVRPWHHQSGGVADDQLRRAATKLGQAAPGALRVVALHHQLIDAPWRSRKKPVARRHHVLLALVDAGAELFVGGHVHQGAVAERREFEVLAGDAPGCVISIAPGLGQPRPKRLGEARGCVAYRADATTLTCETYIWRGGDWQLNAERRFPRATAR